MGPRAVVLAALVGFCCTIPLSAQPLGASNPALSLLPKGTQVDWAFWHQELAHRSRARAAANVLAVRSLPEVAEQEPPNERNWNDNQGSAEFLSSFGRTLTPTVLVRGVLADSVTRNLGALPEAEDEDDGAIPLARDTPLGPGERLRLQAFIGDGPHGSAGNGTADYDFYYIGHIQADQLVTAEIRTAASSMPRLDTKVGLYDASGIRLFSNNNGIAGEPDSYLEARPLEAGEYWVLVRGVDSDWPADPFDSASGPKAGSEGPYTLTLGLEAQDFDFFSFDLEAGDIFSAGVQGEARHLLLFDGDGTLRMGTNVNWSTLYPPQTPLYEGGNANLAAVATAPGRYSIAVSRGGGEYAMQLGVLRSPLATALQPQTLFVDFDGAEYDASHLGGNANAQLSSLYVLLETSQLQGEEDAIIDVVMATVHENLVADLQTARNPDFHLEVRNSRDHADEWGNPQVSRVIVGGTQQEIGLYTLGVAASIDVGNFALEETAVVLLDLLANPNDQNSPSSVPYAASLTVADVIGTAIGNVAAHEAGHILASFHTGDPGFEVDLMYAGQDPKALLGAGPDSILGTADDRDVDFGETPYSEWEPFTGLQDNRNGVAYGLSIASPTVVEQKPRSISGVRLTAIWPNPATTRLHVALSAPEPVALRLALYDVLGRRVRVQRHTLGAGEARLVMPVDGLPAGVFMLRAESPQAGETRKVVVTR